MSTKKKLKQTPSQTAGPYLHIGFLPKKVGINSSFSRELNNLILSEKTEGTRIETVSYTHLTLPTTVFV